MSLRQLNIVLVVAELLGFEMAGFHHVAGIVAAANGFYLPASVTHRPARNCGGRAPCWPAADAAVKLITWQWDGSTIMAIDRALIPDLPHKKPQVQVHAYRSVVGHRIAETVGDAESDKVFGSLD